MNSRPADFFPRRRDGRRRGFTLLELLVGIGILVILVSIAVPIYSGFLTRSYQAVAMNNMRNLAVAFATYTGQNDGRFPLEDATGANTWAAAAAAGNEKIWYTALPRAMGAKGVADYVNSPRDFYTKNSILFIPGAKYPPPERRLERPVFAIAMNSRLQRKDEKGVKSDERLAQVSQPSRTVLFFEQGLKDEKKSAGVQGAYDGAPKGTARSFVGRYNGRGVISFLDGHSELIKPADALTETGALPFPQTDYIWTINPERDPN